MNPLVDTIKNLGGTRLAMMGAVSIGLLIFFIFAATRLWTPSLSLLYGDLDPSEATQIVNELQRLRLGIVQRRPDAVRAARQRRGGGARGARRPAARAPFSVPADALALSRGLLGVGPGPAAAL